MTSASGRRCVASFVGLASFAAIALGTLAAERDESNAWIKLPNAEIVGRRGVVPLA
jgi:hypothetical protein